MRQQRQYCLDILDRIEKIERFTADGEAAFMQDDRTQEAVIRCFEVIGEAVKRLSPELTARQPDVPWRSYAGFRDVLIHQYDDVEMIKVWQTVQNDLEPLKIAVQTLLSHLPENQHPDENPSP